MTIDLHSHTTASDGELTPAQLMALAYERGVTTIAVTDHDTTDGVRPAMTAAEMLGITVVPGIELSAETDEDGDVHMLGYFIDLDNTDFQTRLGEFRENRYHRGRAIVRRLNELGVALDFAAVEAQADGAPITRPHIARAMVAAGHAPDLQTAFDNYLADDAPAYVRRMKMTPEEAVDLIHSAGGVAVMAHPGRVAAYERILDRLGQHGVDGVEVNHPSNDQAVKQRAAEMAAQYDLITTGGSDFHRPERDGTVRLGAYHPPAGALEALRAKAAPTDAT
ncbi:MAG: PHP domain-containing protein [Chloroflexota bacterium]